jgi:hypothetical protein
MCLIITGWYSSNIELAAYVISYEGNGVVLGDFVQMGNKEYAIEKSQHIDDTDNQL